MLKKPNVIVGISGGVDSAVSALLLKEQGYNVSALFMQNWAAERDDPHCTAEQDLTDARAICDEIGIELQTVNFSQEYWDHVFQYCLDEYANGRTPNPDIWCNREIKFNVFMDYALKKGADFLATGHYARIRKKNNRLLAELAPVREVGGGSERRTGVNTPVHEDSSTESTNKFSTGVAFCKNSNEYELLRGLDKNKDQTYFLYTLNQLQLAHTLFPIGELEKPVVRQIAEKHHFINFNKKDSTGICFIGERKFKTFLSQFILAKPGKMETPEGKVVGQHDGVMFYTIGQRKGLNIGGRKDSVESPWYVVDKDIKRNVLVVAQGHDHPLLYKSTLICDQTHWISPSVPSFPLKCTAKIRYRQTDQPCLIERLSPEKEGNTSYKVTFFEPQWAVTPGQSVVFYNDEVCLGGGIIR